MEYQPHHPDLKKRSHWLSQQFHVPIFRRNYLCSKIKDNTSFIIINNDDLIQRSISKKIKGFLHSVIAQVFLTIHWALLLYSKILGLNSTLGVDKWYQTGHVWLKTCPLSRVKWTLWTLQCVWWYRGVINPQAQFKRCRTERPQGVQHSPGSQLRALGSQTQGSWTHSISTPWNRRQINRTSTKPPRWLTCTVLYEFPRWRWQGL